MAIEAIEKTDALALLARQDINEIINPKLPSSAALQAFRRVEMSAGTARMPVLAALPNAGWVQDTTDDKGTKPASKVSWKNKELIAEEIAVIVPIHENTIEDSNFDIWGQVKPLVVAEFGRVLDEAIFFGTNKPATWSDPAIVPGAVAAGNAVKRGANLFDDLNATFAKVEDSDFDVNAAFTGKFMRSQLRGLKDNNGNPIYLDGVRDDGRTSAIFGEDLYYLSKGTFARSAAEMIVGDRDSVVIGVRQDVQVKLLTEATVGNLNLATQDMVALRFKFRVAYATAFSTVGLGENAFPFAVLTPGE